MDTIYWLIFLMNSLNRRQRYELLAKYEMPRNILKLGKNELRNNGITDIDCLTSKEKVKLAKEDINLMKKHGISFINIYDERYPKALRNIYDPPIGIFLIGNDKILNENILSIVGCRECSDYGKKVAFDISNQISKANIVIASGLAKGIDSFAHKRSNLCKAKNNSCFRKRN